MYKFIEIKVLIYYNLKLYILFINQIHDIIIIPEKGDR